MTREKERQQAAKDYCHNLIGEATFSQFVAHMAGSKWADENPVSYDGKAMLYVNNRSHENGYKEAVDKACDWLDENMNDVGIRFMRGDDIKDIVDLFRKAMKGE